MGRGVFGGLRFGLERERGGAAMSETVLTYVVAVAFPILIGAPFATYFIGHYHGYRAALRWARSRP